MITGIVELENFLPNPDQVVDLAKHSMFYSLADHPETLDKKNVDLSWTGKRSESLFVSDQVLAHSLFDRLFSRIATKIMGDSNYGMRYEYLGNVLFHYLTSQDVRDNTWKHIDKSCVFAGVLYLNEDAPEHSGTVIVVDGKEIEVKNEFNKLVLYPARLSHYAERGFGSALNDARLTLVFFVTAAMFNLNATENSL